MKEQLPAPHFDAKRYVRPTQNWICGKAAQGESCPLGPSRWGRCRATAECEPMPLPPAKYACKPQREEREGLPTLYKCTLPESLGGPCQQGPGQDGLCGQPVLQTQCQPTAQTHGSKTVYVCNRPKELGGPCKPGPNKDGTCAQTLAGRYVCTRSRTFGGSCKEGPMPDGRCGRPLTKCAPVRSLRAKRGLVTIAVVAATVAAILLAIGGNWRSNFINPGELSSQHFGDAFLRRGKQVNTNDDAQGCSQCHPAARAGLSGWFETALRAHPAPFDFKKLSASSADMTGIDRACQRCHTQHNLHQPNAASPSCTACHPDHRGRDALHKIDETQCVACHGSDEIMQAAAKAGEALPASRFDHSMPAGLKLFEHGRPAGGFTKRVTSFGDLDGHPEFHIKDAKLSETANTLRFNHQRHFGDTVFLTNGSARMRLDCHYCHKADASGKFHQKVSYEANCKECHTLQFDPEYPQLNVPHGDPATVRAFLNSLQKQYSDLARREKKQLRTDEEVAAFALDQRRRLAATYTSLPMLEQRVFFSTRRWAPSDRLGQAGDQTRPLYYGCAYCHEVKANGEELPRVTPPVLPDRWMLHSDFDHKRHAEIACTTCHATDEGRKSTDRSVRETTGSRETADILMPFRQDCIGCHSPFRGVAHDCMTCHQYHRKEQRTSLGTMNKPEKQEISR